MRHLILLLLTAATLRADALSDLREALQRLDAPQPLAGTIEFSFTDSGGEAKKPEVREGRATAGVALDANGLHITWAPEQLAAAAREANENVGQPKQPAPTREAMSRLSATQVHDYLAASRDLARSLACAKLLEEKADHWNGQPARLLTFKLEPPLSAEDRKGIKEIDGTARVWIAADGTPLAAESSLRLKGRVMVMIGFEHTEKEQFTFARRDNHLVVTDHVRETQDDGGGQHARSKTTVALRLAAS